MGEPEETSKSQTPNNQRSSKLQSPPRNGRSVFGRITPVDPVAAGVHCATLFQPITPLSSFSFHIDGVEDELAVGFEAIMQWLAADEVVRASGR